MSGGPAAQPGAFSPRAVLFMLIAGLVGFVGLGVLTAYAPELKARSQGGENALSRSAVGYAGLVRLLQAEGTPVVVSRARAPASRDGLGLVIFTPPPGTRASALKAARAPGSRRTLVILPKWAFSPDPDHIGWARSGGLAPAFLAATVIQGPSKMEVHRSAGGAATRLHTIGDGFSGMDGLTTAPTPLLQTVRFQGANVVLTDDAGDPLLLYVGPDTYALTEPDLMNNRGLASLQAARTAVAIIDALRGGQGPVIFDVTLNGLARSRSLLGLALAPPFLGASLCALAAALLMGAHAAARFGPARPQAPALALGKAALLDNTAVLIQLARREPRMGRRYAALVRRALARRVTSAAGPQPDSMRSDAALDRLTPAGGQPFSTLAAEAEAARDTSALMRSVHRLHDRQLEILGERL